MPSQAAENTAQFPHVSIVNVRSLQNQFFYCVQVFLYRSFSNCWFKLSILFTNEVLIKVAIIEYIS